MGHARPEVRIKLLLHNIRRPISLLHLRTKSTLRARWLDGIQELSDAFHGVDVVHREAVRAVLARLLRVDFEPLAEVVDVVPELLVWVALETWREECGLGSGAVAHASGGCSWRS